MAAAARAAVARAVAARAAARAAAVAVQTLAGRGSMTAAVVGMEASVAVAASATVAGIRKT